MSFDGKQSKKCMCNFLVASSQIFMPDGQSVGFGLVSEGEESLGIWNNRAISPG